MTVRIGEMVEVTDEWSYPTWKWPDTETQLLFDVGFSYAMLRQAEAMLRALYLALGEPETAQVSENQQLRVRLGELVAKMENFREKRLNTRDEIYAAGYFAAAKLDAGKGAGDEREGV
jgi:hypothetical protein